MELQVGDLVLLNTKNLRLLANKKLRTRWIGPYPVLQKIGSVSYKL